jgi:hypothetical protein
MKVREAIKMVELDGWRLARQKGIGGIIILRSRAQ